MTNINRVELETRLKTFADSYTTPMKIAYEGIPFTKPSPAVPFLECVMTGSTTTNVTTDGKRIRIRGNFMVNVWCPDGKGSKQNDEISQALIDAFPVIPKTGFTSIEQTPNAAQAVIDVSGWRITPVTMMYRYEGVA